MNEEIQYARAEIKATLDRLGEVSGSRRNDIVCVTTLTCICSASDVAGCKE